MVTILILSSIIFSLLSGLSKSICDLSEENKMKGNPNYWIKNKSWVNKWKNGDPKQGEKFIGSSTVFVIFTDAWHLFGLIERLGFIITYISVGVLIHINPYFWFMLLCYPYSMMIFHLFHDTLNILKK